MMNKTYLLALAAILVAAPVAFAHTPAGTPKNYCEPTLEWAVHDYAPPASGHLIANGQDGNIAGDCNGDAIPADYDGHIEWAQGGGWLSAEAGDGVTTGSVFCFGEEAHHPFFGPVTVNDVVLGTTAAFTLAADTEYTGGVNPDPTTNCGDFESDEATFCPASPCSATFPPGLDGTYQVYVGDAETGATGTLGHICTGGADCTADLGITAGPCATEFGGAVLIHLGHVVVALGNLDTAGALFHAQEVLQALLDFVDCTVN